MTETAQLAPTPPAVSPQLPTAPRHLPTMIVCENAIHARHVRRLNKDKPWVRVARAGSLIDLMGPTPARVIVAEGVDLDADVQGEGSLRGILRQRQLTWGEMAETIYL